LTLYQGEKRKTTFFSSIKGWKKAREGKGIRTAASLEPQKGKKKGGGEGGALPGPARNGMAHFEQDVRKARFTSIRNGGGGREENSDQLMGGKSEAQPEDWRRFVGGDKGHIFYQLLHLKKWEEGRGKEKRSV